MSNDIASQTQPKPTTLPEDSSDKAKPRPEAAKWRVGNLLQAFAPKKKAGPETPPPSQEGSVRPVIGPDKAALFLDSKGRIVSAQPRCAYFFGRQPEELGGLNLKELLKPGFDQEVTNLLAKGQEGSELSFHVLALRKDGSEFATQLSFKFLPEDFGFCWTVFVQAPPGLEIPPASELKPMVSTTETTTLGQTPQPVSGAKPPARAAVHSRSPASETARLEGGRIARLKFEADKRLRQIQKDYGNRLIQLEQDLAAERLLNENLSKKLEVPQSSPAEPEAKPKMADLAIRLEQASSELRTVRTRAEENEAARKQLTADLEKEREANKLSQKKAAELSALVQKLQGTAGQSVEGQAGPRVKELEQQFKDLNASLAAARTEARDWEKKAAELKKSVDNLTQSQSAGQSAGAQSDRRAKELEQQLKDANANLAAARTEAEKHNSTRQRLEGENRNLTEAIAKANADLEKESDANKSSRQKAEELSAHVQKLQHAAEQAEARVRESAGLSRDWEKKVTEFKKNFDEVTRSHAADKNAATQSAQRVKELEQQFKGVNASLAAAKTEAEKQTWVRQRLEAENHNLTETSAKTKLDLDKERESNKLSRKKEEELNTLLQKLQKAADQAEARVRESGAQSRDWEKKAADLKKNIDELTRSHGAEKTAAAQSAQRAKELEQQLKRAGEELTASKAEVEKQQSARKRVEAMNRELFDSNAKATANAAEWAEKQAGLEKKASELEQRARQGVFSLAKANAEAESHRVERERAEKSASSAAAQLEKLKEKLKQQVELERAGQNKIAELEKTIQDRGDDLARAAAALRKESKERQVAQKQSRLVSDMGSRLETNLASLEDAKKTFEISLSQKDEQLQAVERSLASANSSLEKESAERRRLQELLTEAKQQLEKVSADSRVEISRLQAALDLGELQRKQLEGDLLRSRDAAPEQEADATLNIGAESRNKKTERK